MKPFTKFFVDFLRAATCVFIVEIVFGHFSEHPMSMKANFMLSVIISLMVVGFTTYNDREKQ